MITLKNISKSFGTNKILSNVNWTIEQNELIYIHGKNGCGKSTLIKIICDILKYDEGSIEKSNDLNLGALIENPGFLESETVKYNLLFLAGLKKNSNEQKIKEYCEYYELDYDSKTKMKNYSVGMRQKVGIIQAVMEDQNVIIFDEPTRGLDEQSVNSFIKMVYKLKEENKTIIIASHDKLDDLIFTKVYRLDEGKLILE